MFQEGAYDVMEFSPPAQGMNQNISPEILPLDFAYTLENIITRPLGAAQVRFGTAGVVALPSPSSTIMKQFPFIKTDGSKQILLYVQEYAQDQGASNFNIDPLSAYQFSFTSANNAARYVKDSAIKVTYTLDGNTTSIYDTIYSVTIAQTTVSITLAASTFPPGAAIIGSVFYSTGTIYSYDLDTNTLSAPLVQNMSTACIPRGVTFLNKLIICNGVDAVQVWDGTILQLLYDFVKEQTANLVRIDNTRFSFTVPPNLNINDYNVGKQLQITVNGVPAFVIVAARALNAQTLTVTTNEVLPQFVLNQTNVFFTALPPRFNFLFVAYNRIWALGPGAAGIEYRSQSQAMRVYFTYKPGSVTAWFNENTKNVPRLDLSERHGIPDNLEAIDLVNGYMTFIGREKTQVWTGSQPTGGIPVVGAAPLDYNSTLSTGIVHGDLLIDLANDTFFITKTGLQSFSSINVARQFAATSLDAIDPLIQQYVTQLTSSNVSYRSACSFRYDADAIAGFKIGQNKVLCSSFSTSLYSWSLFSGDFLSASSFLSFGDTLYLSIDNNLFKYANGNDGTPPRFGDGGGDGLIYYAWTLPIIHLKGRMFACKRYEIQMDYPSSFTVNPENQMSISINGDVPKSYQVTKRFRFDMRGDPLKTTPITEEATDLVTQATIGFRLDQPYGFFKDRLKFIASKFWMTVSGYTKDGVLSLNRLKLYGITERG